MDPCPFVKVLVAGLAVKVQPTGTGTRTGAAFTCFCEIRFPGFETQTTIVPLLSADSSDPDSSNPDATFHLDQLDLSKIVTKGTVSCCGTPSAPRLHVRILAGQPGTSCSVSMARVIGEISVGLELDGTLERTSVFHNGWIDLGKKGGRVSDTRTQVFLNVRAEPDPRYVFQFDGEPECSPQVLQIQGNIRQPVFSCKFSCDRNARSRSLQSDSSNRGWLNPCASGRERDRKERKGWLIMVHDLSGSPVAAASMVTPFVPSVGTDRVSKSNPGAWLILRPGHAGEGSWRPWGRLEAWRERGNNDGLGCRFELMAEGGGLVGMNNGILLAESVLSVKKGGKFVIDMGNGRSGCSSFNSPVSSPHSSGDFTYSQLPYPVYKGFVMSSTIEGERKCSKPVVQIARRHVTCMEDAAVFVALSAAVDLSIDACQPFSRKLRKELCPEEGSL